MDWKLGTKVLLAASLLMTSGPTPVLAGPGVRPSPNAAAAALAHAEPEIEILRMPIGPTPAQDCETSMVAQEFEPLEGALNRARQSVANTVTKGKDALDSGLGLQGAKHLHQAVIEVQKRIGDLESLADDRQIKREIGKLTWKDQLAQTLLAGERAEIYAHHFAAAEMLMLRRLVGGLADVAETSTKALELNEELSEISKAQSKASSAGEVERLQADLKELQNRRGEFLTASRKASELELEFVAAINRLDEAAHAGLQFLAGLSVEQNAQPAVRVLHRTINNLTQLAGGARLFQQTVQAFDTNINEARNSFDHNVGMADLALQARASQLQLKGQKDVIKEQRWPTEEENRTEKRKTAAVVIGAVALIVVVGALFGMIISEPSGSSRSRHYSPAEKYYAPSSPSGGSGGAYERPYRPSGCFLAGTKVLTPNGAVEIQSLKRGDVVYSFNHRTGAIESTRVVNTMKLKERLYGVASFSDGQELEVTRRHEFYSVSRKAYIPVSELSPGESVQLLDGRHIQLKSYVPRSDQRDVFNFEVEGNHNYFIGEGILVHNKMAIL